MSINVTDTVQLKVKNTPLEKYDTNGDSLLSIFEAQTIKDTDDLELYNNGLKLQRQNDLISNPLENTGNKIENKDECIKQLENKLNQAKDNNGFIGKSFNKIKQWIKLGTDANECQEIINNYKDGKITYDEAENKIESYKNGQTNAVNTVSSLITGVASTAILASAVMTGGLSLGVVALAAGVGAVIKTGIKLADRATNNIKDDEFEAKQLGKDALSGVLDGVVSVGTMGMGTSAVTLRTVTEQTAKQVVKNGIKQGIKVGAISGATMSAGNYTIEAALEDDVDFKTKDFITTTLCGATGGAVIGGIMGGIGSGLQYKKQSKLMDYRRDHFQAIPEKNIEALTDEQILTLSEEAENLEKSYTKNKEVEKQLKNVFNKRKLRSIKTTSARVKGENSVFAKLANRFRNNEFQLGNSKQCFKTITDAYGTRIQLKEISSQETNNIITKALKDSNFSKEQLLQAMKGNYSGLSEAETNSLKFITSEVLDELKEKQTNEVVNALIQGIKEGKIKITRFCNYGDDLSSYFTEKQLQSIIDASYEATGKPLTVVTLMKKEGHLENIYKNAVTNEKVVFKSGALKDSGYATTQMNIEYTFKDGSTGLGELQIRGTKLNTWGDAEHVPYDIRSNKITAMDTKYKSIYEALKNMSKDCYTAYQKYSKDIYDWYRLQELGITTPEPQMPTNLVTVEGKEIPADVIKHLTREGLIEFHNI